MKRSARRLAKAVEGELASLAMDKTRVEIRVSAAEWSATGADAVEILLSPNVGEELEAARKDRVGRRVVTGGAGAQDLRRSRRAPIRMRSRALLVFDEVDAGVGGSAGGIGRAAPEKAVGCRAGAVRHSLGADRRFRRASVVCRETCRARAHHHDHRGTPTRKRAPAKSDVCSQGNL